MITRRTLPLVLLITALAVGLAWILGSDRDGGGSAAGAGPRDERGEATGPADLAAAGGVESTPAASEIPAPVADELQVSAARPDAARVEAGGGRAFRIAVDVPPESPADETLAVLAFAPRAGSTLGEELAGEVGKGGATELLAWLEEEQPPGTWWAHEPLSARGDVELTAPGGAERVWVLVDGRYLYLEEAHEADLAPGGTEIRLEPAVGAWMTGTCVLPAGAGERGVDASTFEAKVVLSTFNMGGGSRWTQRNVELEGRLDFEFRGLPGEDRYALMTTPRELAPFSEIGFRLAAGEHDERRVELTLGASVRGHVRDASGAPIVGVEVDAQGGNRFWFGGDGHEATTDGSGAYVLNGIPPGRATLSAAHDDWVDGESEELELAEGQVVTGVDFVLERGNALAGRVLWPDGRPAEGAAVSARRPRDPELRWRGADGAGRATTDAEGRFEILGLVAGPFSVRATRKVLLDEQGRPVEATSDAVEGEEQEEEGEDAPSITWRAEREDVAENTRDLELVLVEPTGVSGVVRDDTGAPVAVFEVTADPEGQSSMWSSRADRVSGEFEAEDGRFRLEGLYEGTWELGASADGYTDPEETVSLVVPQEGGPVEIVLVRAATLAGLVVDPTGRPVGGAQVATESGGSERWRWMESRRSDETDEEGRFEVENVPVGGDLSLVASSDLWADSEPQPVELEAGARVEDLVIALREGGRVVGEVYDEAGDPMVGRTVGLSEGGFGFGFGGDDSVVTDAAGHFEFEHVTPGKWVVTAGPPEEEMFEKMRQADRPEDMMSVFSDTLSETAEVVDGEETHVRLGATPKRLVRVHGRVTKAGEPVADQTVMAFAEGTAFLAGMEAGRTDEDGWYELTVDRPGPYVIGLQSWTGGGEEVEFPVEVPEADELRFDLVLPLGEIRGRVLGPEGEPLEDVGVRLVREDGGLSFGSFGGGTRESTDERGEFVFGTLWPGTYAVRAGGRSDFGFSDGARWGVAIAGGIEVAADRSVAGVELHLSAPGSVAGIVRDAAGAPAAKAAVFVRAADGRLLSAVSSTTTDAAGRFRYEGVSAGEVTVTARTEHGAAAAQGVHVAAGEEAAVELVLEPATLLIVTAEDADDVPLSVGVSVKDEEGREHAGMMNESAFTELFSEGFSSRERVVGPLPPGRYRVTVTTLDGRTATKPVRLKGQDERKLKVRVRD